MQNLNCHPELVSGSSHCDDEGSPLTPTLSRRARGKRVAFTLAEVLITLAIIGVVAAMTIPTLISNYKKQATETKIKRFYSMMTQAIRLSEVDNGNALTWNKPDMAFNEDGSLDLAGQKNNALSYWNKYYAPYIKVANIDDVSLDSQLIISLVDGSQIFFNNGDCAHFAYFPNGYDENSVAGISHFEFLQCNSTYNYYTNRSFGCRADGIPVPTTREEALAACTASGKYCTCLLEFDNWKFKEDYPYKF